MPFGFPVAVLRGSLSVRVLPLSLLQRSFAPATDNRKSFVRAHREPFSRTFRIDEAQELLVKDN